jgi:hypothetical protein
MISTKCLRSTTVTMDKMQDMRPESRVANGDLRKTISKQYHSDLLSLTDGTLLAFALRIALAGGGRRKRRGKKGEGG